MSKSVQYTLIAVIVLLAAASAYLFTQNRSTNAKLALTEQQAEDRYSRTIQAIAEIQDSLNTISLGEESLQMTPEKLEAEVKMGGPSAQQALDRIAVLRTSISRSKERIQKLEADLKKSGSQTAGLQRLVANLKLSVAEKESQVALLSSRVDSLQTQVTGLTATVAETQDTLRTREMQIAEKQHELATVYYVVGTKKELTQAGVIRSTGGFLGLGKTVVPTATPNREAFTALDTDEQDVIRTAATKARVVSAQAADSYELRPGADGHMELHILHPAEFRKVKQVVILTS
jgi:uncharacterized phage infection (PIP) family protein YhgE